MNGMFSRAAPIAAIAVLLIATTPSQTQAQARRCDGGRGAIMVDLGFDSPKRVMLSRPNGVMLLVFETEPELTVRRDGPAAGRLHTGDVLVAIDGDPITTHAAARRYAYLRPGERVTFSVRREGRVQDVVIVAGARCVPMPPAPPPPPAPSAPPALPLPSATSLDELLPDGWFGFGITCNHCGDDPQSGVFRFREAPVLTRVESGSPAARAGLQPGDRLTHVAGVEITSAAGWPLFSAIQPGEQVQFTFTRDGRPYEVTLEALRRPGSE